MAGNYLASILPPVSLIALSFTQDDSQPILVSFSINLDDGTMILLFNEAVNRSSLDFTQFTLHTDPEQGNVTSFTLTGGTSPSSDGIQLIVEFSFQDLNQIKFLPLCRHDQEGADCYLNFTDEAVTDMVGNPILPPPDPVLPITFVNDATQPQRDFFAEFNYPNETITLIFSETIDASTIDASQISFQTFLTVLNNDLPYALPSLVAEYRYHKMPLI